MRIRLFRPILLFTLCFATIAVTAQQSSSPAPSAIPVDQQPSKEDVMRLMTMLKVQDNTRSMVNSMRGQTDTMTEQMVDREFPNLSPERKAKLKADMKSDNDAVMKEVLSDDYLNGIVEDMVPVYQRHISKQDIENVIAFYASPTGQRFMAELPALMTESMQAIAPRMQAQMEKAAQVARARSEQRIKEIQAETESEAKPAAPATKTVPPAKKPATTSPSPKKLQ